MNKTDKLTKILMQRCLDRGIYLDESGEIEDPLPISVEYRPRRGWYLVFDEARYFYDDGELMGKTDIEAARWINRWF